MTFDELKPGDRFTTVDGLECLKVHPFVFDFSPVPGDTVQLVMNAVVLKGSPQWEGDQEAPRITDFGSYAEVQLAEEKL